MYFRNSVSVPELRGYTDQTMSLLILTTLIFLATLAVSLTGFHLLVEAPAGRKRMRTRLEALQQSAAHQADTFESELLRQAILSRIPALNRILLRITPLIWLQLFVQQSATRMTVATLLLICASSALFVLVVTVGVGLPPLLALCLVAVAAASPLVWIGYRRRCRVARFEELFPDAIDLLARAVRAGHSFTTGLELIATELAEPVATEFRIVYDQQNLGLSLRDALGNLSVRMPLPDVRLFITALQIQRESGGNLGEILDNLSQVIRERFKLLRQVRVYSAEGRMSLYILMAMPPAALAAFSASNPAYIMPLFTTLMGHKMLATGVILQLVGYFVIRKIIRIKV
ncbi:MAG: pilus assembly protein TadB [Acidobacteria bacterium]|nr:MAG: pilus assembly protein TadB [Acidobacteriota bacterium]